MLNLPGPGSSKHPGQKLITGKHPSIILSGLPRCVCIVIFPRVDVLCLLQADVFSYLSYHSERIDEPQVHYLSLHRVHVARGRSIHSSCLPAGAAPQLRGSGSNGLGVTRSPQALGGLHAIPCGFAGGPTPQGVARPPERPAASEGT